LPTIASCVKRPYMDKETTTFDIFIAESGLSKEFKQIQDNLKNNTITSGEAYKLIQNLVDKAEISDTLKSRIINEFDEQTDDEFYKNDTQRTLIIGNGDIQNSLDIEAKAGEFGVDGGMIGRAIFHNPWAFDPNVSKNSEGQLFNISTGELLTITQRLELLKFHLKLWQETWGENKNYPVLKKYFKIYISGFEGASLLRQKLMDTKSPLDAEVILRDYVGL